MIAKRVLESHLRTGTEYEYLEFGFHPSQLQCYTVVDGWAEMEEDWSPVAGNEIDYSRVIELTFRGQPEPITVAFTKDLHTQLIDLFV